MSQTQRTVVVARCKKPFAVRAERNGQNGPNAPLEMQQLVAGRGIPDSGRPIVASRRNAGALPVKLSGFDMGVLQVQEWR